METVELRTERLILRCPRADDAVAIAAACADPQIQRFVPVPVPYTVDDARAYIDGVVSGWAAETGYAFGVYLAATGELAGTCQLSRVEPGVVELGYWTAPAARRRGYTAEASRRLCHWGFDTLGIHRIEWWAVVGNEGSRAVAVSLGFEVEGLLRRRALLRGEPQDWWVGGLLERPL